MRTLSPKGHLSGRLGITASWVVALLLSTSVFVVASQAPAWGSALVSAPGQVECSLSGTVAFLPPLKITGGGTGPSRFQGSLSGCTTDAEATITSAKVIGSFASSPFSCGSTSTTGALLSGRVTWKTAKLSPPNSKLAPSQVNGTAATGSFSGPEVVYLDVPAALNSGCVSATGLKQISVTGTVTLGQPCGNSCYAVSVERAIRLPISQGLNGPNVLIMGPDGALWVGNLEGTNGAGVNALGRVDVNGSVTLFPTGVRCCDSIKGITTGPDGALWFTNGPTTQSATVLADTSIERMTTSGATTIFPLDNIEADGIVSGPDGNLWFTWAGIAYAGISPTGIGEITTSGQMTFYPDPSGPSGYVTTGITSGPDGALWFTSAGPAGTFEGIIGRITTAGSITEYPIPFQAYPTGGITSGPDGALWFTGFLPACAPSGSPCDSFDSIGRITTSGQFSQFSYTVGPLTGPEDIANGPDGSLWFTNNGLDPSIGNITTDGTINLYRSPDVQGPLDIVAGPDGAMWFVNHNKSSLGWVTTP